MATPRPIPGATGLRGSALTEDLSFLLARANALSLTAGSVAMAPHGLTVRSYSVLALVSGGARPSQREIADFLRLDPSQVVALVDNLESRGLVERCPDPTDRRANVVVSTPAGHELASRAKESAREAEQLAHAGLSEAERETLAELLSRIAFPGG